MVLYLISVGLSVTMGMMGFVNLAHGVFAMAGGYVMTGLINRHGVPLPLALAAAAGAVALASLPIERLLYRRLYGGDELDQVLLTMGLVFMSGAAAQFTCAGRCSSRCGCRRDLNGGVDFGFGEFPALRDPADRVCACRAGDGAVARARAQPVWRANPRCGRQSAHGAIGRHRHLAAVQR